MGSFKEFSETLPTIEVQGTGQFLVKIMSGDIEMANVVISITDIEYTPGDITKTSVKMKADVVRE